MIFGISIKGIYLIERITEDKNDNNPSYYIGQAEDVFDRWEQHCNGNLQWIDKSIQEYGCTKFIFRVLEKVSKRSELNDCETKWINHYKSTHGEKLMYNISQTKNTNPHNLPKEIKNEIIQLFNDDISRSIYAIAEKYAIKWTYVMVIRKTLLEKNGFKYDNKIKNIIKVSSGEVPDNWRGNKMTRSLSEKILSLKNKESDDKDIASECNISVVDLSKFYEEYYMKEQLYEFADEIL